MKPGNAVSCEVSCHVMSFRVMGRDVMSYDVMWCHVTSSGVVWRDATKGGVVSCLVI